MRVIADLHRENLPGPQVPERAIFVASAQRLDFPEAAENLAPCVENRRDIPPPKQRLSPCRQQRIFGFHYLRQLAFAVIFPALFPTMKADIHPDYNETEISCTCGAVYHTRSTRPDIKIGICAACHPFFTGEQKFIDTAGRVEKFARRYGSTKATRAGVAKKA
jgi:large subunit ribosomal protein L31